MSFHNQGLTTEFITTDEGNIRIVFHRVSNAYPWLILSPGQGDPAESLFNIVESTIDEKLNIALFDPPGHGLSDDPHTDYSPQSQTVIWEAVLKHLDVDRAFIGGYSYGAYSAAICSPLMAKSIIGLVLIEGAYLSMKDKGITWESETRDILEEMSTFRFQTWDDAMRAFKSQLRMWSDYDESEFYTSMVERDGEIVLRMTEETVILMEKALDQYSPAVLGNVICPILLLHSTLPMEKSKMRLRGLESFRLHVENASIVPIPNCGHTIKEHLPFVAEKIVEFIGDSYEGFRVRDW